MTPLEIETSSGPATDMATSTDAPPNDSPGKLTPRQSLTEVRTSDHLDAMEEADADSILETTTFRGHTKNDQKDMYRMGKRQEFIVCKHHYAMDSS